MSSVSPSPDVPLLHKWHFAMLKFHICTLPPLHIQMQLQNGTSFVYDWQRPDSASLGGIVHIASFPFHP